MDFEQLRLTMITTVDNGIETRQEEHSEGWVLLDTYHPHSCPWDCYRNSKASEWRRVLQHLDILCETPTKHQSRTSPMGSGPGGRVRFGDSMMPGSVSLYVSPDDHTDALKALADHKEAVRCWLYENGEMPIACR